MDLLNTLFYFSVSIGLLVSFHELGHFWMARTMGVKVLMFSIGFGKILFSYQKTTASTAYVLSAIPLGGYVKMLDEREGEVKPEELSFAFNRQPLLARVAIVAAGPIFNLLLAVLLFWSVLVIGEIGVKPLLGNIEPNTLAAQAGFSEGDQIISVNSKSTPTWTEVMTEIVSSAMEGEQKIAIKSKSLDDQETLRVINVESADTENPEVLYKHLGFKPWSPRLQPIIGKVLPESAAMEAGLQTGDLIISADSLSIKDWMQWVEFVKQHANKPIELKIERNGVLSSLIITPKLMGTEGKIGAAVYIPEDLQKNMMVEYSLSPIAAIPAAVETTYQYSVATLKMMGKMLVGKASVENLSGPISIAQYAGQSAHMGLVPFIKFLALVSVSLGVMNLLPIPVLDGGHLFFFALEGIKGKPVSEKIQLFFQKIGIALLMAVMILAMLLDVQRFFN